MDQLVAAAIAEQGLDLLRPVAADPAGVIGIVGAQALGDVVVVWVAYDHRIAALERALNSGDAGGEQAAAAA